MHDAIITTALTRRFGEQAAVDRLDLRVGRGEIYAFLGLNGAGKTTTIRMLLGMIAPTAGSVTMLGRPVAPDALDLWARVGALVETPHAYGSLSVRENLELMRRLRQVDDRRSVDVIIERLGLAPYADRPSRTLSLGNQQRLGLARALLHRPELVILDEPANGLDPAGVVEIRSLLRELADGGVTVFMSSHILSEVTRLATRVGVLHQGRLVQELDASELDERRRRWLEVDATERPALDAMLRAAGVVPSGESERGILVEDPRYCAHPDRLTSLLVSHGIEPTRVSVESEDLEHYFLRLIGREEVAS